MADGAARVGGLSGRPTDLAGLATVTERFEISDNDALVSLEQVAALASVGDRLVVTYNSEPPQVDAVAWGPRSTGCARRRRTPTTE